MSQFADYVDNNIAIRTLDLMKKEFQSEKRFFWVLRNPGRATAEELLIFSEYTGLSCSTLLDEHKIAALTLGTRERRIYKTIQYAITRTTSEPENGADTKTAVSAAANAV